MRAFAMRAFAMRALPACLGLCFAGWALAAAPLAWAEDPPGKPPETSIERRLRELEESNAKLRAQVEKLEADHADLKDDHASLSDQVQKLLPLSGRFSGYLDFGFFHVQGDGSGIRADVGNTHFPEYSAAGAWVFMGDPLATAVNSRGEPASTGDSRAVTFDPIHNDGKASFIVNALNLSLFASIGESLTVNATVDFVPRGRNVSDKDGLFLGDFIDIKRAYAEYLVPVKSFKLTLDAGKIDSVLGYEYRSQESSDRLGVTPSLMCRYTCGRPLGLKARAVFLDDAFAVALAVTNGGYVTENFPFAGEIDQNDGKTVAGRISSRAKVGSGLEVGVSGSAGSQDLQPDDGVIHWHYGVDLHLDWHDLEVTAEAMGGRAQGKSQPGAPPCSIAPCLHYKGAYLQAGYRLFNWLEPYARVDFRDALHQNGDNFVYVSDLLRVTGGLHSEIGTSVIVKAEYTHIQELGRAPQFPDDVFTSSLVVKY